MTTRMTTLLLTSLFFVCMAMPAQAAIIVDEYFNGDGDPLNGTTANVFSSAIGTAGGSSTWDASSAFSDNGATTSTLNRSALLDMGSYINDTKGTATGNFTLTATLSSFSGDSGDWGAFGFFRSNASISSSFVNTGAANILYRGDESGLVDAYASGTSKKISGPAVSGTQLLKIVLDLTPAGGYNGTNNFGTITYYYNDTSLIGSTTLTSDLDFSYVGLSTNGYTGTYSSFTLDQVIPEPATMTLLGAGSLLVLRRRRH